jgi:hypothetical protein
VGLCGVEISNSLKKNETINFSPERFATEILQNGYLAYRSAAKINLRQNRKSSVISELRYDLEIYKEMQAVFHCYQ